MISIKYGWICPLPCTILNVDLELGLELTSLQVPRWHIDGIGDRDGVHSQKVQHKYESGAGATDGVDPPKNWPHFGTLRVIKP